MTPQKENLLLFGSKVSTQIDSVSTLPRNHLNELNFRTTWSRGHGDHYCKKSRQGRPYVISRGWSVLYFGNYPLSINYLLFVYQRTKSSWFENFRYPEVVVEERIKVKSVCLQVETGHSIFIRIESSYFLFSTLLNWFTGHLGR